MIKGPKLTAPQWKLLSSAFSNMGQAITLFSLAAFFSPEAVSLPSYFSPFAAIGFLFSGLFTLLVGVIIIKKAK